MNEDLCFQALRQLQANTNLSQRQLAKATGLSLGRTSNHPPAKPGALNVCLA